MNRELWGFNEAFLIGTFANILHQNFVGFTPPPQPTELILGFLFHILQFYLPLLYYPYLLRSCKATLAWALLVLLFCQPIELKLDFFLFHKLSNLSLSTLFFVTHTLSSHPPFLSQLTFRLDFSSIYDL